MRAVHVLCAVTLVGTAACDSGLGPPNWDATPVTGILYSLSRSEYVGQPSAYDFVGRRRIVIESPGATGDWDLALAEESGQLVFLPAGLFPGIDDEVLVMETEYRTLAAAREAPSDTSAYERGPIRVDEDAVYIIRTRRATCITYGAGPYYGKFQVLSVDAAAGSIEIAVVRNQYCNDRSLIPPGS